MSLFFRPSESSELYHYGILGMKWGVRRYQNYDGTLTEAGKRRRDRKDSRWASRNYDKIYNKAYRKSKRAFSKYVEKDLNRRYESQVKSGMISRSYLNDYNQKLAFLMNQNVNGITAPSGRAVRFVARRGDIGVEIALADAGYDMNEVRNGVYGDGRIAYKKTVLRRG